MLKKREDKPHLFAAIPGAQLQRPGRYGVKPFDYPTLWEPVGQQLSVGRPIPVDSQAIANIHQRLSSQHWLQRRERRVVLGAHGDENNVSLAGCINLRCHLETKKNKKKQCFRLE